ncbi:MAG: methyltransferase [Myxococcota bacterium]
MLNTPQANLPLWKHSVVAPQGTHHVVQGNPLYSERFDEVLKFHAPGFAPVRKAAQAWHIDEQGQPIYPQRFIRTFGFYEGRAAVSSQEGFFHILPDGAALNDARYAWCGNYQGGLCPVRTLEGHYFHILPSGTPAYTSRWCYAGDFRDGVAVVQSNKGCSTHIDRDGHLLHNHWYLDLDVFHKGFARARDRQGWMHINIDARPCYLRRFASVEPFYNGQARVERFDGGLEVIAEDGSTIVELRPAHQWP